MYNLIVLSLDHMRIPPYDCTHKKLAKQNTQKTRPTCTYMYPILKWHVIGSRTSFWLPFLKIKSERTMK